jgi:hypothetical protein
VEAVIVVLGIPELEAGDTLTAQFAAAVDECFADFPYFRDVKMGGDAGAVGKGDEQGFTAGEVVLYLGEGHGMVVWW